MAAFAKMFIPSDKKCLQWKQLIFSDFRTSYPLAPSFKFRERASLRVQMNGKGWGSFFS
jgi:hypothetical protein